MHVDDSTGGIVQLILWNRHIISWPGKLPAGRRVAHANVPLMSSVLRTTLPLHGSLLDRPSRRVVVSRPVSSFHYGITPRATHALLLSTVSSPRPIRVASLVSPIFPIIGK